MLKASPWSEQLNALPDAQRQSTQDALLQYVSVLAEWDKAHALPRVTPSDRRNQREETPLLGGIPGMQA